MFLSVNLICKMISKTKIGKRIHDKKNPFLVETLIACKKNGNENWMTIARFLSVPTKKRIIKNLEELEKESGMEGNLVIPGKVLSQGEISKDKKIKVIAFDFSDSAIEKLVKNKIEYKTILDELKSNPKGEGMKIIK